MEILAHPRIIDVIESKTCRMVDLFGCHISSCVGISESLGR